jgi:hypothetical protein
VGVGDVEDRHALEADYPVLLRAAAVVVLVDHLPGDRREDPDGLGTLGDFPVPLLPLPETHHVQLVEGLPTLEHLHCCQEAVVGAPAAQSVTGHGVEPAV